MSRYRMTADGHRTRRWSHWPHCSTPQPSSTTHRSGHKINKNCNKVASEESTVLRIYIYFKLINCVMLMRFPQIFFQTFLIMTPAKSSHASLWFCLAGVFFICLVYVYVAFLSFVSKATTILLLVIRFFNFERNYCEYDSSESLILLHGLTTTHTKRL